MEEAGSEMNYKEKTRGEKKEIFGEKKGTKRTH